MRSKLTAVTGSTNSKSTAESLSKTVTNSKLNIVSSISKLKSHTNLKEIADSFEEDYKNYSNKLETIAETNEEKKSEESKSSGNNNNNNQQPIIVEVHESAEEIKQRLQDFKFRTDPTFTKSTRDFIKKLATHFLAKDNRIFEWTSFVNTVHNLFTQHTGKIINKNENLDIDEETKEAYFLYILNYIYEKEFFAGEIFLLWKQNKWRTLKDMNKLSMVTVNKDKLIAEWGSISDKNLKNLNNDNSNSSTYKSFGKVLYAIFKTLREQNFWQPLDGSKIQKPKYLSNIQHFINQYAKSKEWNEEEKNLIKSDKKLNLAIYNSLVEKKIVCDRNNIVEFNQTEIDNLE